MFDCILVHHTFFSCSREGVAGWMPVCGIGRNTQVVFRRDLSNLDAIPLLECCKLCFQNMSITFPDRVHWLFSLRCSVHLYNFIDFVGIAAHAQSSSASVRAT